MTNLEKYNHVFLDILRVREERLPELKYLETPKWDSMGHMTLIGACEEAFEIMMETPDILSFTSYKKGKEVLKKYGVEIDEQS